MNKKIISILAFTVSASIVFNIILVILLSAPKVELDVGAILEPVKCPVCEVCPKTTVQRLKAETDKYDTMKDSGLTDADIKNIIADKENILQIIK